MPLPPYKTKIEMDEINFRVRRAEIWVPDLFPSDSGIIPKGFPGSSGIIPGGFPATVGIRRGFCSVSPLDPGIDAIFDLLR